MRTTKQLVQRMMRACGSTAAAQHEYIVRFCAAGDHLIQVTMIEEVAFGVCHNGATV